MKFLQILTIVLFIVSCNTDKKDTRVATNDYVDYLGTELISYTKAKEAQEFWSKRLNKDTTGIGDIGPLAGAYTSLFEATGDVTNLYNAEKLFKKGMDISAHNKDAFARGLAHNYIAQHRFKEAQKLLEQSYKEPSNKHETELMLFDVYMELGYYDRAHLNLKKVKNNKDYHYLIRLSKWSDYRGDLDAAITYMEQAKAIAESRNSKPLKIWTYSNLADYYGHAGRIDDAYKHYLMTLKIQPDNAYVKKGLAWIAYANDANPAEAHTILDTLIQQKSVPDYYLFKAELFENEGNITEATNYKNKFIKMVEEGDYGNMYNTYLIELYTDINPKKALTLAKKEINNRAIPETYHLLALAQLTSGNKEKALKIIEFHVEGKTFEPMALYHSALVWKANGLTDKVAAAKDELKEAAFELGPLLMKEVVKL